MLCHECWMRGEEAPAVALCRHCSVGLCKEHLVEAYRHPAASLIPSCRHRPSAAAPEHPAVAAAAAIAGRP
jgi:hypothetical protein